MTQGRRTAISYIMRFSPAFLDEIRARLPVSAVVGKRVALKKAGKEWRGLSPFASEKTPSFFVNDQKGFYHCFSSGKHGDQFTFLMETEGLSFPESVERLAGEAGLPLPKPDPEAQRREEKAKSLAEICELGARWFEQQLQGKEAAQARAYLVQRELSLETQKEFRIGYAPSSRHGLKEFLAERGVSVADMITAGLVIGGEDIPVPYDRFRDRVMFPIQNARGQVIAFGGRAMAKDQQAKYLNSPETPLFHKGAQLYNLHRARAGAHTSGQLVLVEGYTDVISLHQAGFPYAVAPLGTAFTEDQLKLVWRLADTPVFCFDGDKAGLRAADRTIDVALPHLSAGHSLNFALLPAGLDPDDFVRQRGREAFEAVLHSATPLVDMLWEREVRAREPRTPEQRAAFEARLRDMLRSIQDVEIRKYYSLAFKTRLEALTGAAKPRAAYAPPYASRGSGGYFQPLTPSSGLRQSRLGSGTLKASWSPQDAFVLGLAIRHPSLIENQAEDIAALELADPELAQLRDALLDVASDPSRENLQEIFAKKGLAGTVERVFSHGAALLEQFLRSDPPFHEIEADFARMIALHRRNSTLNKELAYAKACLEKDGSDENLERLASIQAEIEQLKKETASARDKVL